jgi:hypothetical protein
VGNPEEQRTDEPLDRWRRAESKLNVNGAWLTRADARQADRRRGAIAFTSIVDEIAARERERNPH